MRSSLKKPLSFALAALTALPFSARADQDADFAACARGVLPDTNLSFIYKTVRLNLSFRDFPAVYKNPADKVDPETIGLEMFEVGSGDLYFIVTPSHPPEESDGITETRAESFTYRVTYRRLNEHDGKLMGRFIDCAKEAGYPDVFEPSAPTTPAQPLPQAKPK